MNEIKPEVVSSEEFEERIVRVAASAKKRATAVMASMATSLAMGTDAAAELFAAVAQQILVSLPMFKDYVGSDTLALVGKCLLLATVFAVTWKSMRAKNVVVLAPVAAPVAVAQDPAEVAKPDEVQNG